MSEHGSDSLTVERLSSGFYRLTPAGAVRKLDVVYARRPVTGTHWQAGRDLGRRDLVWDGPTADSLTSIIRGVENGTIQFPVDETDRPDDRTVSK